MPLSRPSLTRIILTATALIAVAVGVWQLEHDRAGLAIDRIAVGSLPVTVFRPVSAAPSPVVIIAHGFAGSQQLMQAFAVTLARNGYIAVTFDFPGHGRNPEMLRGGLTDPEASGRALLEAIDTIVLWAGKLSGSDGRMALIGHSMASDIVVRYAVFHPEIAATVAVSLFAPDVTATSPRNLLVIDGALEPAMMTDEAYRVVGMAAAGHAQPLTTYGDFHDGSARRLVLARGVEHIAVLYSRDSMEEALAWLDQAFGRHGSGVIERPGPWLGLIFLGLVLLARPLSGFLPSASRTPAGGGFRWVPLLILTVVPALATPLILWKVPTDFMPVLLGDYLAAHFLVFGLLTGIGAWLLRRQRPGEGLALAVSWPAIAMGAVAVTAYSLIVIGGAVDRYLTSFMPVGVRLPLILAVLAGTLPYFLADEWLVRGAAAQRGAYALTKLGFLVSLMIAVALNPMRLFFLVIIIPVMLIFFIVFGLFSGWTYPRTQHPFAGGLANAMVFAWAIAVTFPIVMP